MMRDIYEHLTKPIIYYLSKFPEFLGKSLVFISLAIIGYVAGRAAGTITKLILSKFLGIEDIIKKYRLENALYGKSIVEIIVLMVRWYIYVYFIAVGLNVMGYNLIQTIMNFMNVLYGSIGVFIFGLFLAEFVKNMIEQTTIKEKELVATLAKGILIYIFFVLALKRFGIDAQIFLDILRYFALAAAISFGLTFGVYLLLEQKEKIEKLLKK